MKGVCGMMNSRRFAVAVFAFGLIFQIYSPQSYAFSIGKMWTEPVFFTGTIHQDITADALRSRRVSSPLGELAFGERAIFEIQDANIKQDEDQGNPKFHFDNNDLAAASEYIKELKEQVLLDLKTAQPSAERATEVRKKFGQALHALQDFYSHTNWVNRPGGGAISKSLGRLVLDNEPANPLFGNWHCDPLFYSIILSNENLFSGWAIGPLFSFAPPAGECIHGLVGNGIHKDWPGRQGFERAKSLAQEATIEFVFEQLLANSGNNPQMVCLVMRVFSDACGVTYLKFVEGNPGIAGDGVTISVGASVPRFHLSPPYPMNGLPEGITLTIFPASGQQISQLQVNFIAPGPVGSCPVGMVVIVTPVTVNGVSGVTTWLSPSSIQSGILPAMPGIGCPSVTINDVSVFEFVIWDASLRLMSTIDAAAIGVGPGAVPTSSTPPP